MPSREIFLLVVRVMGAALIIAALLDFFAVLLWLVHLPTRPGFTPLQILAATAVYLVTGVTVILSANMATRLVYGRGA